MWKSSVTLSVLQVRFLKCVKDVNTCIYLQEQRFLRVVHYSAFILDILHRLW